MVQENTFRDNGGPYERRRPLSRRIDPSWLVFASLENAEHDHCVDLFVRPDGSHGFEAFRRDVEDSGAWTPVGYFSSASFASAREALDAAERAVPWLVERLRLDPALRVSVLSRSEGPQA